MHTDLIVRFIQNIRVHRCPSVVYKYTNLACSTLGHKDFKNYSGGHPRGATATLMAKLMDDSCEACFRTIITRPTKGYGTVLF